MKEEKTAFGSAPSYLLHSGPPEATLQSLQCFVHYPSSTKNNPIKIILFSYEYIFFFIQVVILIIVNSKAKNCRKIGGTSPDGAKQQEGRLQGPHGQAHA